MTDTLTTRDTAATTAQPTAGTPPTVSGTGRRVLTGDRPTGALHLGHYFGTLANRALLQQQGHDVFVVIADYQVIADRDHPGDLTRLVTDLVLDYLACGLDPAATTIFPHSAVPDLNQLLLPFLSLVSTGELDRNPTVKQEIAYAGRRSVSGLMITYPVHQAADILFCQGELVPVGRDQLPHLELTRSIARRFNERYGDTFVLPEALLGQAPVLAGLDGRKMSKSLDNTIRLCDSDDQVAAKIQRARTDSERAVYYDPQGRPEVANLLTLAALCLGATPQQVAETVGDSGGAGLKRVVTDAVVSQLAPIRARRAQFEDRDAAAVLAAGTARARTIAAATLDRVRGSMGMAYPSLYG